MGDVLTREQRRRCMSRIRSEGTKPEVRLRRALWRAGFRYRLKNSGLVGKPDLLFPGSRVAVFVDGCFWHKCELHYQAPNNNARWWQAKIEANVVRDRHVDQRLRADGWTIVRIWEHEIDESIDEVVEKMSSLIRSSSSVRMNRLSLEKRQIP